MAFHPTRFWNFMARRYARSPVKDNESYQYKLGMTANYLTPQDRLLEFGCGTGTTALIHAPRVSHIDAIDFSSEMIAIAREKAEAQAVSNVRFEISSFEDWRLSEGDAGYDAILGLSILHLVTDLDATLARVYQQLKPGGLFMSSTVCIGEVGGLIRYALPPLGAIGVLPKILLLTPDMLTDGLRAHGFDIEHVWRPEEGASVFIVARRPA
ncbi:bifunctional 2-polyprenyl-6-hydroxyphenol methylase/3-demethylubiquinol 3-O-methyltransferase UbiG [Pararhizobium sp. IMCC21322]|uniref:class I SAM-dependent methyltransferase n=1 Tax=Pararhizobium sp. IMCC21322 TaxID=3067903 RepID=UPI0027420E99|nr:class I SAM-dependent methyltransferase [Pararhizobium sp. IMCC21322]